MRKFAISLCFALAPAVVAVLGAAGGGTHHSAPAPAPKGDPNPVVFGPGRLVPIGGGRTLYLKCEGHGTPTVILAGGTADRWTEVQDAVARSTRTCSYDQAGLGNSLPAPGVASAAADMADLERLLQHAGLPAPYVLVGAGHGRLLVRLYARAHPSETRDVVATTSAQPGVVAAAVLALVRGAGGPAELAARTGW